MEKITFEEIYEQNKRRIYFHIHQLNIQDPHQEFFQIGLTSLWQAYQTYQPDHGPMSSYFNYIIRNRLIDELRRQQRYQSLIQKYLSTHQTSNDNPTITNPTSNYLFVNPTLHIKLKTCLTQNQWDWLYYCVLQDMSSKELAVLKDTTVDAVKSWARQARRKLRCSEVRRLLVLE